MDIESTTPKLGSISTFDITTLGLTADIAASPAVAAVLAAATAALPGTPEKVSAAGKLFAWALFNHPDKLLTKDRLKVLCLDNRVSSIKDFVYTLGDGDKKLLAASILYTGTSVTYKDASDPELIEKLQRSDKLKAHFKSLGDKVKEWEGEDIDVNPFDGLHLLLAQPDILKVVMENRKRQAELELARATKIVVGPVPVTPAMLVAMRGGMTGGSRLNSEFPIEMRGAGPMLASMRAGFGMAIGIGNNYTQWRSVGDVTFISGQLRAAYNNLVKRLKVLTGKEVLNDAVKNDVDKEIAKLEEYENKVKERRDKLNKFNEMISSGQSTYDNTIAEKSVDYDAIKANVALYNDAQKRRHSTEMKIFRVISTLGLKLQSLS